MFSRQKMLKIIGHKWAIVETKSMTARFSHSRGSTNRHLNDLPYLFCFQMLENVKSIEKVSHLKAFVIFCIIICFDGF